MRNGRLPSFFLLLSLFTMFATYLHPETVALSKAIDDIQFTGYAYPHFAEMRHLVAEKLSHLPTLPLTKADLSWYELVHDQAYLQAIQQMARSESPSHQIALSRECAGYEFCLPAYEYGLGGFFVAIEAMKQKQLQRAYIFCLGGHHAFSARGHGYCLLNPQAVAVKYAQAQGFERILIIDWDIHHGDGTQTIFAHDPTVHCLSIHSATDLYMTVQRVLRLGTTVGGTAVGHTNIPILSDGFGLELCQKMGLGGTFYESEEAIPQFALALNNLPFEPDLVMIFAGFDGHKDDQGGMVTKWTNDDFAELTRLVLSRFPTRPILSAQGGGYTLDVVVPAIETHVRVLYS